MTNEWMRPARLMIDGAKLIRNWRALDELSGPNARCGAAVKADAYGLGATETVRRLHAAGCRDFFVATWQEAEEIDGLTKHASVSVLDGVLNDDLPIADRSNAKPMLNSIAQVERWRTTGRPCDVMINSGMNRLGIDPHEAAGIDWHGFDIDILASHLASADEDTVRNAEQLEVFRGAASHVPHRRTSIANSAGVALSPDYACDLTRPGLALYGGVPRDELAARIEPVASLSVRVLQCRQIEIGGHVGYNATWTASTRTPVAIIAVGYADGYKRAFSNAGQFFHRGRGLPVIGRVSMDLVAIDISAAPELREGDWVGLPLNLPVLTEQSGLSPYELLTGLGSRFDRIWTD
ncbi:MAG: alanine racemase [Pontixanthobacter sp.]